MGPGGRNPMGDPDRRDGEVVAGGMEAYESSAGPVL